MKTYYKRPTREVRIVRPDPDAQEWEFWVLEPKRIGGGKRLGTRRIRSDNSGNEYVNLAEIVMDDLNSHGYADLANELAGEEIHTTTVNGVDLVAAGKWHVFAAMRKLDAKDVKAMQKAYALTPVEIKKLEINK
jgi:hypothetical protein